MPQFEPVQISSDEAQRTLALEVAHTHAVGQPEEVNRDIHGYRMAVIHRKEINNSLIYFYPSQYYRVDISGSTVRYYFFGTMHFVERQNSATAALIYRHGDQVDSTVFTSNGGTDKSRRYTAYGKTRSGAVDTAYTYTDQFEDGTGLYYYKARYYDPNIGIFISPDTIIPDPSNVLDYNRYAYVRGNPVSNNDPTGQCAARVGTDDPDGSNATCWALADTISQNWDRWNYNGYWNAHANSAEDFTQYVASSPGNGADYFARVLNDWFHSDDFRGLPGSPQWQDRGSLDMGDYTAINAGFDHWAGAIIVDDYGNVYLRIDNSLFLGGWGASVVRGDVLVADGDGSWTDIDHMGLANAGKAELAPNILIGPSRGASFSAFNIDMGGSYNMTGLPHMTIEGGFSTAPESLSISIASYTMQIYPVVRWK